MPTQTGVKRKAPLAAAPAPSPSSKQAKKHTTRKARDNAATSNTTPMAGLARRFISSLAKQLTSDGELGGTATATATSSLLEVEGAFHAALGALPKGKLKRELQRDEAATIQQLAAELGALNNSHTASDTAVGATSESLVQRKGTEHGEVRRDDAAHSKSDADPTSDAVSGDGTTGEVVVPCTVQLYGLARQKALRDSNSSGTSDTQCQQNSLLRALALNPRAPLDLLVDAMWEASAGAQARAELLSFLEKKQAPRPAAGSVPIGAALYLAPADTEDGDQMDVDARTSNAAVATLKSAVDGMRNLVKALAADPNAAVSASGLAFYAHRAAVLAEAARYGVLREWIAAAAEGRSWSGGGADGAAGSREADGVVMAALGLMLRILQVAELASSAAPFFASAKGGALDDPAGKLLLPCVPETTRTGSDGSTVVPAARRSIARLLADYAVVLAACSAEWKGGAAALIKGARAWAAGGGDQHDDSSDSSSGDEESDEEEAAVGRARVTANEDGGALSRHLLTLCAAHLSGDEGATLEFLRCVGDASFVPHAEDQSGRRQQSSLSSAVSSSLAWPCARALSRLPRPNASPAPTATLFLKRAYAARVVEALGRTPASSTTTSLQKRTGHRAATTTTTTGSNPARPWDFVGAAPAPRALLDFLGRPEAPVAVGDGEAGEALRSLAARRESAAAVGELLRSSKACAPAGLGALLAAMERFSGMESGKDTESGEGGGQCNGQEDEVCGFFVDTGGSAEGAGAVLSPLGEGGDVQDMDEEQVSGDEGEGSEEDADALGFVVDTDGQR